jgi:autotransporter-associated beta strand protein
MKYRNSISHLSAGSGQAHSPLPAALALAIPVLSLLLPSSLHAASQKFVTSGTFTPPVGITSVMVECWGGGGAGGGAKKTSSNSGGGGGGGGAYAMKLSVPVTPGTPYTITIPAEATCPASGWTLGQTFDGTAVTFTGDSDVSVTANGGIGGACAINNTGAGGAGGAAGVGFDLVWKGGDGKANSSTNAGGGGGGASDLGAGNDAVAGTSTAGAAKAGSDADHAGGAGAGGKTGSGAGNTNNTAPGGGGGGGRVTTVASQPGSAGKKGQIIITYSGATVTKDNNADDLNLGSSWVGGNAPEATGIAKWDSTVTAANTTVLGSDVAWGGISITNPTGMVTINAGNILTLSGGIDMSSADPAGLTLNCPLALSGSAVWNLAANRTLTLSGIVSGSFNITEQGAGKVVLAAANTYSGVTAIAGGTLELGASDVIPNGSGKGDVAVAATCTLDLNGFSDTINGLSGAGIVDNTAASTASTLTVGDNNIDSTFSGVMRNSDSGSTLNLVKTGSGQLTLSGNNTFTGTVAVNVGALNLGTANPLTNISGITMAGGTQLGYQANNVVVAAPITLVGNVTVIQNISGAVLASLNGAIGGTGNMTFLTGNPTMNGGNTVTLGAASNFVGNVTITTTDSTTANNMTVKLGVADALPATAEVTLDGQNGNGSSWADLNLNGFDQTLAGLRNIARTSRLQRVYNSGATAATLTISNTADYSFGGTLGKASGNNFALTKSGTGRFTLTGANTFTGATKVTSGILSLGHSQALQSSTLDTLNSNTGDATNGLQTAVTTLTLGGLTGNQDLASVFTTTAGGYDTVTALTLNPGNGDAPSYAGSIAGGAPDMSLTKSGLGTQTLTGSNSYTGPTTVAAGTLALGASNALTAATAVAIGNATLSIGAGFANTVGTLDATSSATINVGAGATLAFADSSAIDWTGGALNLTGTFVSGASLRFGTGSGGLTSDQLALISATGFGSFAVDANGYLTASATGGYAIWAAGPFTNPFTNTLPGVDFDNDGLSNLLEFVLGGDPTISQAGIAPTTSVSGGNLVLTFKRSDASELSPAVTVKVELSTDLTFSTAADDITIGPADDPGPIAPSGASYTVSNSGGFDTITVTIPQGAAPAKFARVKAIQTP